VISSARRTSILIRGESKPRAVEISRVFRIKIHNDWGDFSKSAADRADRYFEVALTVEGEAWIRTLDPLVVDEVALGPWKQIASSAPLRAEIARVYTPC
jgi:hypothetical protein